MKLPRKKKCPVCLAQFQPVRPLQQTCLTVECAYGLVKINQAKKQKKEYRAAKEKAKSKADFLKEAQAAVNKYIRLRDKDKPCISCGRSNVVQWHAGHFRSVGACPELRFEERNIHKQCSQCNDHLSGNILEYRIGLVERAGAKEVEWLEGKHDPKHYTIDEIKLIKSAFTIRAREIQHD